jgi:hypothetical protein
MAALLVDQGASEPDEDTIAARLDRIEAPLAGLASVLRDDAT